MAEASEAPKTKNFTVRDVPIADHEALERARIKLGMKREAFARALVHRAIWSAAYLFQRDLAEAIGPEVPLLDEEAGDET